MFVETRTDIPACAAIVGIALEIGARRSTTRRPGITDAFAGYADLFRRTFVSARAAILRIVLDARFTSVSAFVGIAIGISGGAMLAALGVLAAEIHAGHQHAFAARPRVRSGGAAPIANLPAGSAVRAVRGEANALAVALGRSFWAAAAALPAELAGRARDPACPAVLGVVVQRRLAAVVDEAVAVGIALGAHHVAAAGRAEERRGETARGRRTDVAARAAVIEVVAQIRRAEARDTGARRVGRRAFVGVAHARVGCLRCSGVFAIRREIRVGGRVDVVAHHDGPVWRLCARCADRREQCEGHGAERDGRARWRSMGLHE